MTRPWMLLALASLAACRGMSPLTNKIEVGSDSYVVMVGEGTDRQTDLYAVNAGGGEVARLTFTRDSESVPALDPSGSAVAFLRSRPGAAAPESWLVVMNLVNSAERETRVPGSLGKARRIGWSRDGRTLYVSGDSGYALTPAPPATLALARLDSADSRHAAADSAVSVLLGDPPRARVESCATDCISTAAAKQCVVAATGERQELGPGIRGALRWGADSMAYFEGEDLVVRPLAGGQPRRVPWVRPPAQAREATYWGHD